ncbi:MAG TPA: hypothetical protein VFS21_09345 [Roseiflexaceae bacterium]|nr:hypothetical protein [Roseiflexaceae bacterium]
MSGKIVSRARQLRLDLSAKLGRTVTAKEVAAAIGYDQRVVLKIENDDAERVDLTILAKLSSYYHQHGLDARHVLEYEPEKNLKPDLVAA